MIIHAFCPGYVKIMGIVFNNATNVSKCHLKHIILKIISFLLKFNGWCYKYYLGN